MQGCRDTATIVTQLPQLKLCNNDRPPAPTVNIKNRLKKNQYAPPARIDREGKVQTPWSAAGTYIAADSGPNSIAVWLNSTNFQIFAAGRPARVPHLDSRT
ncbi:hypothetical protein AJ79_05528 [Helicocarpus griseus UAMH5409]|uniref:Uncharacterized protein n=1 Tax=Helicocarpus griseus UAMH5409 TaxID=1447875 RepID=A0A2B7XMY8_9EURO|nr:hypothetical protein AJ79_05528 [Helicocarpus griseus UAMH5409]